MELITLLIAAGAAVFFGLRLFSVLGKKTGHTPDLRPVTPASDDADDATQQPELAPAMADAQTGTQWVVDMDPAQFADGARKAYELVVEAFAKGDKAVLEPLLTPRVYDRYVKAIDERDAKGLTTKTEVERIAKTVILNSEQDGTLLKVQVRFSADIATETKDKDGNRVSGDIDRLNTVDEIWTFEKDANSRDPNWKLARVKTA